jgi:hypothetical protein
VLRWITTIAVIAATLANGQWFIHCKPSTETAVTSTEELPECCRDGFCPHHAAEHKAPPKPQKNDADDCICGIASSDPINLVTLTPVAAIVSDAATVATDLLPAGIAGDQLIPTLYSADLLVPSPPPWA